MSLFFGGREATTGNASAFRRLVILRFVIISLSHFLKVSNGSCPSLTPLSGSTVVLGHLIR